MLVPIFLIVFTVFSVIQTSFGQSQATFELRLRQLDRIEIFRQGSTRLRICLKHYQSQIDLSESCTFGEHLTQPLDHESLTKPIELPLNFKWPGTFSLVIEAFQQNKSSLSLSNTVDPEEYNEKRGGVLLTRVATKNRLLSGADWTQGGDDTSNESPLILNYEYRMQCSKDYYGPDCDTVCRPRNDEFGHYKCNEQDGNKICLKGWQKDFSKLSEVDYCTKAICSEGCDGEHGFCDKPNQCKCRAGWKGSKCNQCIRYPGCVHGTCNKAYDCNCKQGWGGLFCNEDLNYCANNRPCQNGATCRNSGQGSYTCSCPPGFTGRNCERRVNDECSTQQCLNGGTCQKNHLSVEGYNCICPIGYRGERCELRADTCSDMPCQNGATCYQKPSSRVSSIHSSLSSGSEYMCSCRPGYEGVNCEVKVDSCHDSPCSNGGTCVVVDSTSIQNPFQRRNNAGAYQCICPAGFSGLNCETNIDECASNPCRNGATCFDFVNDYKCYCHAGFVGKNCEHNKNDCRRNPCQNGGTCHDGINSFVCTCPSGYTGKDCSVEVNECATSPCLHGICIDKLNDFECKCLPGYLGRHCNVLPDGSVLPLQSSQSAFKSRSESNGMFFGVVDEPLSGSQIALIVLFAAVIPFLAISCATCIWCRKERRRREQIRSDADAQRENELNAVHCIAASKMSYMGSPPSLKSGGHPLDFPGGYTQTPPPQMHHNHLQNEYLTAKHLMLNDGADSCVSECSGVSQLSTASRASSHHSSHVSHARSLHHLQQYRGQQQHRPKSIIDEDHKSSISEKAYGLPTAQSIQSQALKAAAARREAASSYSLCKPQQEDTLHTGSRGTFRVISSSPTSTVSTPARPIVSHPPPVYHSIAEIRQHKQQRSVNTTNSVNSSRPRPDTFATEV